MACEKGHNISFDQVQFSVEGMEDWVNESGIPPFAERKFVEWSTTYKKPDDVVLYQTDKLKLELVYTCRLGKDDIEHRVSLTEKTYFRLKYNEATSMHDLILAASKLTTFLCFAIGQTVSIKDVVASNGAIREKSHPFKGTVLEQGALIFYSSIPYTPDRPKINKNDMLFCFSHLKDCSAQIFGNWLDAYRKLDPAISIYFSAVSGGHNYLDRKFIALVQALEIYHRKTSNERLMPEDAYKKLSETLLNCCPKDNEEWLKGKLSFGNEISLKCRLKYLIAPFEGLFDKHENIGKLIKNIGDTRNYHTHYDRSLETREINGEDLWKLCMKVEAIFQLILLQELGLKLTDIESVVAYNSQLKRKLGRSDLRSNVGSIPIPLLAMSKQA